jgi:subtilisin family serine protease
VNTEGVIGGFSSYGPSADGRVKPDVCAVGEQATLITPSGQIVTNNGTSFAAPQIAGLAASLWSALPKENAMQIRERIIRSADRYDNPDYSRYGYGIPDAWKAYTMELPTDLDAIENTPSETESHKILHNGQLYILRNGRTYSVSGLEIVSPY